MQIYAKITKVTEIILAQFVAFTQIYKMQFRAKLYLGQQKNSQVFNLRDYCVQCTGLPLRFGKKKQEGFDRLSPMGSDSMISVSKVCKKTPNVSTKIMTQSAKTISGFKVGVLIS